ncbi:MAG TPA: hypothetical protein VLZ03_15850, partial [Thermodesulfobacteriota bacterium]|nr:hypothetical protein [Thermodesulfobacteriota bacterium]
GQEQGLATEVQEALAVEVSEVAQEQDDRVLEGLSLEILEPVFRILDMLKIRNPSILSKPERKDTKGKFF